MAGVVSAVEAIAKPMTILRILIFPFYNSEALDTSNFSPVEYQAING